MELAICMNGNTQQQYWFVVGLGSLQVQKGMDYAIRTGGLHYFRRYLHSFMI